MDKILVDRELTLTGKVSQGQKIWWLMRSVISDGSMHKVEYTAYLSHNITKLPGEFITAFTTKEDLDKWRLKHGWSEAQIKKDELTWYAGEHDVSTEF